MKLKLWLQVMTARFTNTTNVWLTMVFRILHGEHIKLHANKIPIANLRNGDLTGLKKTRTSIMMNKMSLKTKLSKELTIFSNQSGNQSKRLTSRMLAMLPRFNRDLVHPSRTS